MGNNNIKILLIDYNSDQESVLINCFNNSGYNVCYVNEEGFLESLINDFVPQLVIARIKRSDDSQKIFNLLKKVNIEFNIPVAVISSIVDIDFYINGLKAGIFQHIKSPLSKNYLIARVNEIIQGNIKVTTQGKLKKFEFNYNDNNYVFEITGEKLINLLLSIIEDSSHQTEMLMNMVSKRDNPEGKADEVIEIAKVMTGEDKVMEKELYRALDNDEFRLFYQPVIDIEKNIVSGFESLIRWEHPEKGLVFPDSFIPVAENSPIIIPLGYWIIDKAASQLKEWQESLQLSEEFRININLSARQFVQEELSDKALEIIANYKIDSKGLAFEITESAFMEDKKGANLMLLKLKSMNHLLYLDDFGTGYSSLSYLQHFPVDVLKIDKSFVEWMHIDEHSEEIVNSVISLAHNLKMKVVAEGVESEEHLEILKRMGCDYGQGYYYAKPLDSTSAKNFIINYNKAASKN